MQDVSRRAAVLVCLVGLAAVAGAVWPAGAAATDQQVTGPQSGAAVQERVDPDVVVMRVTLAEDGRAEWRVAFRTRLDDDNTTAAFESLQADVQGNSSAYTDRFATGMRRTVRSAENRTGREMRLENVTVDASKRQLGQEYGVVTYRFTWTAFATVEDDQIRAGEALSGLFLDSETSLVVAYPDGYAVADVTPAPDENRSGEVVWRGQIDFGPDQPRLVVAPAGASGPGTTAIAGGALALLTVLAAAGYVLVSRGGADEPFASDAGEGDDAGESSSGGGAAAAGNGESTGEEGPPAELLTNEERVLRLLEAEGGRVKQQQIASEFDWTDAKTSQVVGGLREEDAVETFRIGRENVVTLPGENDF